MLPARGSWVNVAGARPDISLAPLPGPCEEGPVRSEADMQRRRARKRKPSYEKMLDQLLAEIFKRSPGNTIYDWARIVATPHWTADAFATAVVLAAGYDAEVKSNEKTRYHHLVRHCFIERFGDAVSAEDPRFSLPED
jgi:hypothetical protein